MGSLPVWFYRVKGIEIEKTIGMVQGENTVLVRYRVRSGKKGSFSVRPVMRFAAKGSSCRRAGFCGGSEVHCEQWCDSFLWDKWGASDGEGEDLEDLFLSRMRGMEEMASEVLS